MSYQVFIESPHDSSRVLEVAAAIGLRYGLPDDVLVKKMKKGRFRVKKDIDLETARAFVDDLDRLGARATIVGPDGTPVAANATESSVLELLPSEVPQEATPALSAKIPAQPSPFDDPVLGAAGASHPSPGAEASGEALTLAGDGPLLGAAGSPAGRPEPSPLAGAAVSSRPSPEPSPLAGAASPHNPPQEQTGLSAALSAVAQPQELGALGSDGGLSVASLDRAADQLEAEAGTQAPADDGFAPPSDEAFMPPEASLEQESFQIDVSGLPERRSTEMVAEDAAAAEQELAPPPAVPRGDSALVTLWERLNEDLRLRLAVGVALVTLLGFVPVHLYASMAESSAYGEIGGELEKEQQLVEDVAEWEHLDERRAIAARSMDRKRVRIAVTGGLIWVIFSAGLGFAFFRLLPWEDRGPRIAPLPER